MNDLLESAWRARRENRLADAQQDLATALALCREAADGERLPFVLIAAGQIERDLGNIAASLARYEESVALLRAAGRPQRLAHTLRHVADIHRESGNLAAAEPLYEEAIGIYRKDPDTPKLDLANALRGFALLLAGKGEHAGAVREEARAIYSELGIVPGVLEMS